MSSTALTVRPPAQGLAGVLADLVSEPRLDRVLTKIVHHARSALAAEVALLAEGADGTVCEPPGALAPDVHRAVGRWLEEGDGAEALPILLSGAALRSALGTSTPGVASLCAAAIRHGEDLLGILVAVSGTAQPLGEEHLAVLEEYAGHAGIALMNARMFAAQEARAKRDPLTGLLNHSEFHESVAEELSRGRRTGVPMSVVTLDLDRFKAVNDTAGHGAGDRVLQAVAGALADSCRRDDSAFRVGGDEFALVLPRTDVLAAAAVARRVAEKVEAVSPVVGISFGIAGWPEHGPTKAGVLAHADAELYEMKSLRRGKLRPAAGQLSAASLRRRQRERLAVAGRLATKLGHAEDAETAARLCVDELHHAFDYYLAVVQRLDPDGMLRVVAAAGPLTDDMSDFLALTQAVTDGVNGRVARTGEAALVADTRLDPDYLRRDARKDPGSELSVPIHVHGRVWGVLNLEQVAVDAFAEDDLLLIDTTASQLGAALHRCELAHEIEHGFLTTLAVLSDALEVKDAYTAEHALEVTELAEATAARLRMSSREIRTVRHAALTHDLGKLGIRSEILRKPGPLDEEEWAEIRRHTISGAQMLERIPFLAGVAPIVRASHERFDGAGYPDGLAGEDIPVAARILAACDAFHAMTSDRPYRSAMTPEAAVAELEACAGTQFDPEVVTALVAQIGLGSPRPAR